MCVIVIIIIIIIIIILIIIIIIIVTSIPPRATVRQVHAWYKTINATTKKNSSRHITYVHNNMHKTIESHTGHS